MANETQVIKQMNTSCRERD